MANSILHSANSPKKIDSSTGFQPLEFIRGLIWKMAIAILILMAIGSATRVMNAGLACPDWPLCYGELVPTEQMNLQVFLEWFHRLDAAAIGLMAIGLVGVCGWFRRELPRWLPWAAIGILATIVFQGVLGALTVTQLLRFDIVTAHLGTALLLFVAVLVVGLILTPYQGTGTARRWGWVSGAGAILVYFQSLLGGLVASQWALHQCFGNQQLCIVMNGHIAGVVFPTVAIVILLVGAWRTPGLHPTLRKTAHLSGGLLVAQISLGVATFYLHLQVEPLTVAHQTVGALLLGSLVAFTILAMRDDSTSPIKTV
ncbi:heme A synthase [Oscillatoriales cyanobacterium LEGE 11467]|uniref:Heme A synthase n=1 Tax=Zarconia navalis LEGE 11467 TaxID=1828826 RepID=A0A928Z6M5_9CYAN|nr:heme A synthase [Zarconia navalis]MBE9040537.1 heme A synthase [Zarconia navalis LEGE 11467]